MEVPGFQEGHARIGHTLPANSKSSDTSPATGDHAAKDGPPSTSGTTRAPVSQLTSAQESSATSRARCYYDYVYDCDYVYFYSCYDYDNDYDYDDYYHYYDYHCY